MRAGDERNAPHGDDGDVSGQADSRIPGVDHRNGSYRTRLNGAADKIDAARFNHPEETRSMRCLMMSGKDDGTRAFAYDAGRKAIGKSIASRPSSRQRPLLP